MLKDSSTHDTIRRLEAAEKLKIEGEHTEALEILEQLIVEDPTNVAALEEIADNELSIGHMKRAEIAAQEAIALDKESYTAHYILGFLYGKKELWQQSLDHLQYANTVRPNDPEILRSLGWALLSNNKRTQGIVTLERSLNLDKENPLTLCDLGVAYLEANNMQKAKILFMHALELDPANDRARQCVTVVEKMERSIREEMRVRQTSKIL